MDILQNGGMIVVIGDPRFKTPLDPPPRKDKKTQKTQESLTVPFLQWAGVKFAWDSEPGDTVIFEDDYDHKRFADYNGKLSKWEYSLAQCNLNKETLGDHFNLSYIKSTSRDIHLFQDFFCRNRYKHALAFTLRLQFRKQEFHGIEVFHSFGPLIFLPKISMSEDETVQLVLANICGIESDLPEPAWLDEFLRLGRRRLTMTLPRSMRSSRRRLIALTRLTPTARNAGSV